MKKTIIFLCLLLCAGLLFPCRVMSKGLGEAGSLTYEALVIGLAVLGVIILVFLGLLLLARSRELTSLETDIGKDKAINVHPTSEDVMSLSESEIGKLIHERDLKPHSTA